MRFVAVLAVFCAGALGASKKEWVESGRVIYQVLTDRFAGPSGNCGDLSDYCGGTYDGMIDHLSYVEALGAGAIWISPIVDNCEGGYHGYWARNVSALNSHFGDVAGLKRLVSSAHEKGIWVMLDVVGNHVGGCDGPWNTASFLHDCSPCPSDCNIADWSNQQQVELCRLSGLPDLNQTRPEVASALLGWLHGVVEEFGFDGIRVDTVPEVHKGFWAQWQEAAGVFAVGEVFNGDVDYNAYYTQGGLNAVLSYPLFFSIRSAYAQQQSLTQIQNQLQAYSKSFAEDVLPALGTFVGNHDNTRFLYDANNDHKLLQNAVVFALYTTGIPILYYGDEQGFNGGSDPNCREPLWPSNFDTSGALFQFFQTAVTHRSNVKAWMQPQVQRYADDNFYAFTRGSTFIATTNVGSSGPQVERNITYQPYADGTTLCNLFYPTDCVKVHDGFFTVYLDSGEAKIFDPK